MAIKHVPTGTKGVSSNFDAILSDFEADVNAMEAKTKGLVWEIFNDVEYAQWVKQQGTPWYPMVMDHIDVSVRALRLPLKNVFSRRISRADLIANVNNTLMKVVTKIRNNPPTPIYSGLLAKGYAEADNAKVDKRYYDPTTDGWNLRPPAE